jgi:hypothetical protein
MFLMANIELQELAPKPCAAAAPSETLLSVRITCPPSAVDPSAIATPMLCAAPVMTQRSSASRFMDSLLSKYSVKHPSQSSLAE